MKHKGMHYQINHNPYVATGKFSYLIYTQHGVETADGFNSYAEAQTAAHETIRRERERMHSRQ